MKLKGIHLVLDFTQSQWLKLYVDFNTQKRIEIETNSDNDGKPLYKLMNNALFGKSMGNLRNTIGVRLVINKKDD